MSDESLSSAGTDIAIREAAASWFARLQAEDASDIDRLRWRQWMEADARHPAAYQRLQARWSEIGDWAGDPAIKRRLAGIAQAAPGRAPARRARTRYWLAAAASLVAIAVCAGWWMQGMQPEAIEYATGIGEQRAVTLDDGTRVELDTDTRMRVTYSRRDRAILFEQGRAHFEVVRDGRPMQVQTTLGEIRVVGTVFEVDRHADALDVTLLEGRVDVAPARAGALSQTVEQMQAGDRLSIDSAGGVSRDAFAGEPSPWRSGRLVFDDLSLRDAVSEFNRYSKSQIRLGDAALADIRVSGTFRSDDPRGFIEALDLLYRVSASHDAAGNVTLSRQ